MKRIGLVLAMHEELTAIKKYLNESHEKIIYDLVFYEGKIGHYECVLVECGVGKVNAARTTQVLIDNFDIDYVINIGVAGGVDERLNIGDIVIGS